MKTAFARVIVLLVALVAVLGSSALRKIRPDLICRADSGSAGQVFDAGGKLAQAWVALKTIANVAFRNMAVGAAAKAAAAGAIGVIAIAAEAVGVVVLAVWTGYRLRMNFNEAPQAYRTGWTLWAYGTTCRS